MFKNYLKIALRKLFRSKVLSVITIGGLTLGITISSLLTIFLINELSYDAFHSKSDRTFRIVETFEGANGTRYFGQTAPALGISLEEQLPEVEKTVRLFQFTGHIDAEISGQRFGERKWYVTEPAFFEVFDFEFIHGNEETALVQPNSIVITENLANKYFGRSNVLNETISFSQIDDVTITGVLKDIPNNSHLQFNILLSRNSSYDFWDDFTFAWNRYGAYTYLLLENANSKSIVENKASEIALSNWAESPNRTGVTLQPIQDIYLESENVEFGLESIKGQSFYINLFIGCSIFVLLIAGINYTNLSTANSISNSKEIGVRKVNGAYKKQLVGQFLTESIVTALLAFSISIILIDVLLPYMNLITGKSFDLTFSTFGNYFGIILLITISIGLISGIYPAFYLSAIKPLKNFKTGTPSNSRKFSFRSILVVTQFSLSAIFIIATIIGVRQMNFIQSVDKGFEEEQILVIDINSGATRSSFETIKEEFEKVSGVLGTAVSSRVPGEWKNFVEITARNTNSISQDSAQSYFMGFDEDMLSLYDINLTSGRNFQNIASDTNKVMLNETAVTTLGLTNPIGELVTISELEYPYEVIGVIEDFNYQSLHQTVEPLIIGFRENGIQSIDYFSAKLSGENIETTIASLKEIHSQFDTSTEMEYNFLDQQIEQFYTSDLRASRLFLIGASFTLIIACMGLFGLTLNMVQIQKKEIGIRKVLGASVPGIVLLLSKNFTQLIGIAFLIAIPVSYFIIEKWLQSFAYSVDINLFTYLISGSIILSISWITISFESIKAALVNPVESLRSE